MNRKNGALTTTAAVAIGGVIWTSVALSTPSPASATAAPAATAAVVLPSMTISSPSIPTTSPLGQPLSIGSADFGDQQGPSGGGGGVGPIEFSPLVVTLPGGPVAGQLPAAYGQPLTVAVDLPDGHKGGYIEYVFSNATLSSTKTHFVAGRPASTVTLEFAYNGERATVH